MADITMPGVPGLSGPTTPAVSARLVTPSDATVVNFRCLWVGGAGDLNLLLVGDTVPVLHKNVPVGVFQAAVQKVMATSTTATLIVGWL